MKIISWLIAAVLFAVPVTIFAANIVPCEGVDCNACHLVSMGQNIIRWFVAVFAVLGGIVFVVAGLKMASAGGNTGSVSEAKGMMTNVVVGLIIMLAAWILINTVMTLFVGNTLPLIGSPWYRIECVAQPTPTAPPPAPTACPVPNLSPFTEPPSGIVWTGTDPMLLTCVNRFIAQVGGSVTSAYRPADYQTHLREVWDRWCTQGLSSNNNPACNALQATVSAEMGRHALSCARPVGVVSNHSSGRAVDISGINHGSPAVLQAATASCLSWPLGTRDPVHYELRSGCTCN